MRILWVRWLDSAARPGWRTLDGHLGGPATCESVGYLAAENKEAVVLVQSMSDDGDYGESITIPRKCILKKRTLK